MRSEAGGSEKLQQIRLFTYLPFFCIALILVIIEAVLADRSGSIMSDPLGVYYSIELCIVLCIGAGLFLSCKKSLDTDPVEISVRKNSGRIVAWMGLVTFALILFTAFTGFISERENGFLRHSRLVFYFCVLLIWLFEYLVVKHDWTIAYLFIVLVGLVLIFTDLEFSVIDEGAHIEVFWFIMRNGRFPTTYEHYEGVQGPVYYYLMAFLLRWLPVEHYYLGARVFGLICFVSFGLISRKTIDEITNAGLIDCPDGLINAVWLLFVANPNILIRLTRVSNESLMCVLVSIVILLTVRIIVYGLNKKLLCLATALCALAFLTKSTSVFIFGLVFIVCIYYHEYLLFLKQLLLYSVLVAPWFIHNYMIYGALTGMKGHLTVVLPIVNPTMERPDILSDLIRFFHFYFLIPEVGIWYDYAVLDQIMNVVLLLLLALSTCVGLVLLFRFIFNRLDFTYSSDEKKQVLFVSFSALPFVSMVMHAVQTLLTYNDSLIISRYLFMLNGVLCMMLLLGMSGTGKRPKTALTVLVCAIYAFVTVAFICSYTESVTNYLLSS